MTKMTKPAQSNQWSHFVPVKTMPPIFQYDILNQDYTKPFCWHRNNPTVKNTLPIMKNIFSHLKKFGEAKAILSVLYRTIIEFWNHFSNQLFQRTEISKPKKAPKFDPDILKIGLVILKWVSILEMESPKKIKNLNSEVKIQLFEDRFYYIDLRTKRAGTSLKICLNPS